MAQDDATIQVARTVLDGPWLLGFDEGAAWEQDSLPAPGSHTPHRDSRPPGRGWRCLDDGQEVHVPSVAESVRPGYHGVSWWSHELTVAGERSLRLRFGAARLLAEVYWDRTLVGVDLEGYTPFEIPIPAELSGAGSHRVDVRITNPGGSRDWEDMFPLRWSDWVLPSSHDFGGLWQPVELEAAGSVRIDDIWARPQPGLDHVCVDVRSHCAARSRMRLELIDPGGRPVTDREVDVDAGQQSTRCELRIGNPQLYAPGSPHVYTVVVSLSDGLSSDIRTTTVGLRILDAPRHRLQLNGEDFYLRTAISWGWYTNGPIATDGELDREVDAIEALGQNALSAHRFPSTPALQDKLEQRGLLLYQEPGGGPSVARVIEEIPGAGEMAREYFALRLRRLARRDRSRACLVWWNVANEVIQLGDEASPLAHAMLAVLREEDASRLSTWTSAWGSTPMFRPFVSRISRSWDQHTIMNWPSSWNRRIEAECMALEPPRPGLFLAGESFTHTSLGGLPELAARTEGVQLPGSPAGDNRRLLDRVATELDALDPDGRLGGVDAVCAGTARVQVDGVARMVAATRMSDAVDGLAINGWHSHPDIGAMGLTTFDRSLALDPAPVAAANAPVAVTVLGLRPQLNVGVYQDAARIAVVSDDHLTGDADVRLTVVQDGRSLWESRTTRRLAPHGGRAYDAGPAAIPAPEAGVLEVHAQVTAAGQTIATTTEFIGVATPRRPSAPVALHDPRGRAAAWLNRAGVATVPWRMGMRRPVLITDSISISLHTTLRNAPRVALLTHTQEPGVAGFVATNHGAAMAELGMTVDGPPESFPINGDWLGGWAFTIDAGPLPSLGRTGVWGWGFSPLFPRTATRGLSGRVLAGALSFPYGSAFDPGPPAAGATVAILGQPEHELLYTTLPLVDALDDGPLAGALLTEIVAWLART